MPLHEYYDLQKTSRLFGSEKEFFRYLKTLVENRHTVTEFANNPGDLLPYHSHRYAETLIVLNGNMRVIVEEEIIDLTVGDMLTIHPWAIHLLAFPAGKARYYRCSPSS